MKCCHPNKRENFRNLPLIFTFQSLQFSRQRVLLETYRQNCWRQVFSTHAHGCVFSARTHWRKSYCTLDRNMVFLPNVRICGLAVEAAEWTFAGRLRRSKWKGRSCGSVDGTSSPGDIWTLCCKWCTHRGFGPRRTASVTAISHSRWSWRRYRRRHSFPDFRLGVLSLLSLSQFCRVLYTTQLMEVELKLSKV